MLRQPKVSTMVYKFIHMIPHLELTGHVQPLTRTMLHMEISITADFQWTDKYHQYAEPFWIFIEDVDGEHLLHVQYFLLKKSYYTQEHHLSFTVPLFDPLPPQYFIRVISDKWLGCDISLPVSFRHLLLPEKFTAPTELLDLQPLSINEVHNQQYRELLAHDTGIHTLNAIQTQVFQCVYKKDDNVLIAAPGGSGKTLIAELSILRMLSMHPQGRCVYLVPLTVLAIEREKDWAPRFQQHLGLSVVRLTGDNTMDTTLLATSRIIITTPLEWEAISRRWKTKAFSSLFKSELALFIIDELHLIGNPQGPWLELIISRMRYIQTELTQTKNATKMRIVGLASSMANAKDVADWLGCTSSMNVFNFHPNVRPIPVDIRLHSLDVLDYQARQMAMIKPAYKFIHNLILTAEQTSSSTPSSPSSHKPIMLFAPDKKQVKLVCGLWMNFLVQTQQTHLCLKHMTPTQMELYLQTQQLSSLGGAPQHLVSCLCAGVGYLLQGQSPAEQQVIVRLYQQGVIRVLCLEASICFGWNTQLSAYAVIILGTHYYDEASRTHLSIPITSLLQMMSYACRPQYDIKQHILLFCLTSHKEYLKKFLFAPLPVESHLHQHHTHTTSTNSQLSVNVLHNMLLNEIIIKRITNIQGAIDYMTWTLLYRRLVLNPNYYNLTGTTHRHLSDYLSEMMENIIEDLLEAKMITTDQETEAGEEVEKSSSAAVLSSNSTISILNLGMITSYYHLDYTTVEIFNGSVSQKIKLKGLMSILSSATEFTGIIVRDKESAVLQQLSHHVRLPVSDANNQVDYTDTAVKVNILLQCHLSRVALSTRLQQDLHTILLDVPRLLFALIDVLSSHNWLSAALSVMELCQMMIQAQWNNDSVLMQLPHFDATLIRRCQQAGIHTVPDILEMEDEQRNQLLQLTPEQLAQVATVCNAYPDMECQLAITVGKHQSQAVQAGHGFSVQQGDEVSVIVTLIRDADEDVDDADYVPPVVSAQYFPVPRSEGWWLVLGNLQSNELIAIKRVILTKRKQTIELTAPASTANEGEQTWMLYLMCDSYLGVDQEHKIPLLIQPNKDIQMTETEEDRG